MRIVIIDDGVSKDAIDLQFEQYSVVDGSVQKSEQEISCLSHGSICAKIIEKYIVKKDVTLISIKILNDDDVGDISDLITALRWCLKKKIDFINMSLGTPPCRGINDLNSICQQLHNSGCRIIAASNNSDELSFPSGFPCVTSVEQKRPQTEYKYWYRISDIISEGEHELSQGDKLFYSERCNSYACAYVSAQIINKQLGYAESLNKGTHILPYKQIYDFSMLSNVVILSNNVDDKQFCFKYTTNPCNDKLLHVLVIIPDKKMSKKDILICLNHFTTNIELIVWCGDHTPRFLQKWCKNKSIKFWDESVDSSRVLSCSPEMPIIQFLGQDNCVFDIMAQFNAKFINDGYNSIQCSNLDRSYLFGVKKLYNEKSLALYAHHFKPDTILFYMHNKEINISDVKVICKSENHIEIQLEETDKVFNSVNDAYLFLLARLDGEKTA